MGIAINLGKDLIDMAKAYSSVHHRSVPKQVEHWARIGRIAEQNRDLTFEDIEGILLGLEDAKAGRVEKYRRGVL